MKTTVITTQVRRQRKLMLILPAIVLPFLTILFWSMKSKQDPAAEMQTVAPGLNTHLPGARLRDTGTADKLSFYEQADLASRKLKQERQQDPYARTQQDTAQDISALAFSANGLTTPRSSQPVSAADVNEQKIYERLSQLQKAMDCQPTDPPPAKSAPKPAVHGYTETKVHPQEDPDLKQMNHIMEKLVQLQHPETIKPATRATKTVNKRFRAVTAVIDGKQRITDHTVIRMKLLDSATISGQLFPKGQQIYAAGLFSDQRMKLDIRSIHIGNMIYPVDLTVFDAEDGLEGINVPEAITGDALRGGAASSVQSLELMSLDPSLSAQLATAGVNTAKGLFGKKVKRIKAKLQDKRPILLRINQPMAGAPGRTD